MARNDIALGIDVGGTFTDVLAFDRTSGVIISAFKVPSTPANPAEGAMTGVDRFPSRSGQRADAVFHGTTVGTNALITKNAAKTALVTTKGFRDVLALRRHARPRLYDLSPRISPDLAPRERRIEVEERMQPDGTALVPLKADEIAQIVQAVAATGAEAVAVCFLHSYANDTHERAMGAALQAADPDLFVTLSSDVCREFREFERTSTAAVNAFIGPPVQRYVDHMADDLAEREIPKLSIVKSNGGLTSASNARRYPVHLIESGPAAGIIACAALGKAEGIDNLIAFDMGGTTAKAGVVIDGQPRLDTEFYADRFVDGLDVGGYPIQSPVIDLIEIGAGGGSLAWIDAAGVIKVGPESAGADPGPASYGRGGTRPTVTDAHVAVGHVAPDGFGSEDLDIDVEAAREAIRREIAEPMGWSIERAAWGASRDRQYGRDGALGDLAARPRSARLRPRRVWRRRSATCGGYRPRSRRGARYRPAGAGTLQCDWDGARGGASRLVQTRLGRLLALTRQDIEQEFKGLEARAAQLIAEEDAADDWQFERSADLRFEGQLFELTLSVPWEGAVELAALETAFRTRYRETYGYDLPSHIVQLVNLRLTVTAASADLVWPETKLNATGESVGTRMQVLEDGTNREISVVRRHDLTAGEELTGPAIVEDFGATIRILSGQRLAVCDSGTLILSEQGDSL